MNKKDIRELWLQLEYDAVFWNKMHLIVERNLSIKNGLWLTEMILACVFSYYLFKIFLSPSNF
jgi:hypothetical protein